MDPSSTAPKLLHQQEGLRVERNRGNSFVVITLHHTADPSKRSVEWRKDAEAGLTPEYVAKELDIDYTALYGATVFPQIKTHRSKIVIPQPHPVISPEQLCWAGFDWGGRNPTAFHVYTLIKNPNGDRAIAAIWEHYGQTTDMSQLVETLKRCPYWDQIRAVFADLHIWDKNQNTLTETTTRYAMLTQLGLRRLMAGNDNEDQWVAQIHAHWRDLDHRDPTFLIFDNCYYLIDEFKKAIYAGPIRDPLRNYKEKLVDKHNHALDACKYFMNTAPISLRNEKERKKPRTTLWKRHMT